MGDDIGFLPVAALIGTARLLLVLLLLLLLVADLRDAVLAPMRLVLLRSIVKAATKTNRGIFVMEIPANPTPNKILQLISSPPKMPLSLIELLWPVRRHSCNAWLRISIGTPTKQ